MDCIYCDSSELKLIGFCYQCHSCSKFFIDRKISRKPEENKKCPSCGSLDTTHRGERFKCLECKQKFNGL